MELRPSACVRTRRPCYTTSRFIEAVRPARALAAGAEHGLDEMTVIQLLGALVDKSVVTVSFPSPDAAMTCSTRCATTRLERLAQGGGVAAPEKRTPSTSPRWRTPARCASWTRLASVGRTPRAGARQPLAALTYAQEAPDAGIAGRLGTLAWYFTLAERVSKGAGFVELALASASEDAPAALRLELLAFLCYFATEELDLEAAIEIGERALAASEPRPPESALVEAALSLALAESGDGEHAAVLAENAHARLQATGRRLEHRGGQPPAGTGRRSRGRRPELPPWPRTRTVTRAPPGSTRFQVPAMLLEAWVAERRSDTNAAADAYQRAFTLAGDAGFADHAAFAVAGLGWPPSRAETCALPRSSSAARSPPRRRRGRRGQRRTRASGWPASSWPLVPPTPPSSCTETCSSGPTRPGRAKLARVCSSRSPTTRARPPGPARRPRQPQGTAALPARAESARRRG